MKEAYRILDVNFNRAREAIRVIEDYLRLVAEDLPLWRSLRSMRRTLGEISQTPVLKHKLLPARASASDIGRPKQEQRSKTRNTSEVLSANLKRLQEALRVLEEYTKTISVGCSYKLSQLRFKSYEIEPQVRSYLEIKDRFLKAQLYVLLPEGLSLRHLAVFTRATIKGGAEIIQLREKSVSDRVFITKARLLRRMTQDANMLLIINDRVDITRLVEADGVHLGKMDLTIPLAREIVGGLKIIGATTHQLREAIQAQRQGADYISVGPFFKSPSKPHLAPRGFHYLPEIARHITIPYVAIGGINTENLSKITKIHKRVFDYPLKVAISSGIFQHKSIEVTTRKIKKILTKYSEVV